MARLFRSVWNREWKGHKKLTSQGTGGRGRRTRIAMSTMNKNKRKSHKKYRGQGR
jgi:hypothetical protein